MPPALFSFLGLLWQFGVCECVCVCVCVCVYVFHMNFRIDLSYFYLKKATEIFIVIALNL